MTATQNKLHLLLEHESGGDLSECLEKFGRTMEDEARATFRRLYYRGMVHRDLKPDCGPGRGLTDEKQSICGTVSYTAQRPRSSSCDGLKLDVWSPAYPLQAADGELPCEGADPEQVSGHTLYCTFCLLEHQKLLTKLMTPDPGQRPTLEDTMKAPGSTWARRRI